VLLRELHRRQPAAQRRRWIHLHEGVVAGAQRADPAQRRIHPEAADAARQHLLGRLDRLRRNRHAVLLGAAELGGGQRAAHPQPRCAVQLLAGQLHVPGGQRSESLALRARLRAGDHRHRLLRDDPLHRLVKLAQRGAVRAEILRRLGVGVGVDVAALPGERPRHAVQADDLGLAFGAGLAGHLDQPCRHALALGELADEHQRIRVAGEHRDVERGAGGDRALDRAAGEAVLAAHRGRRRQGLPRLRSAEAPRGIAQHPKRLLGLLALEERLADEVGRLAALHSRQHSHRLAGGAALDQRHRIAFDVGRVGGLARRRPAQVARSMDDVVAGDAQPGVIGGRGGVRQLKLGGAPARLQRRQRRQPIIIAEHRHAAARRFERLLGHLLVEQVA
jgi:hypothetical protein